MSEEVSFVLESTEESMQNAVAHLERELIKIRAGKATTNMLDSVLVEYYGSMTKVSQVSNISTPDGRTIQVQPWEKTMLQPIERAIINSNLGFAPMNNGEVLIINLPPLTEERRKELSRQAKGEADNAKVTVRNARKDANGEIKKLQADGLSEDMAKDAEGDVQKLTDKYVANIDSIYAEKDKEIMTV